MAEKCACDQRREFMKRLAIDLLCQHIRKSGQLRLNPKRFEPAVIDIVGHARGFDQRGTTSLRSVENSVKPRPVEPKQQRGHAGCRT